jgi:hypothetical protein
MVPLTALNGSTVRTDYCWGAWIFIKFGSNRKNTDVRMLTYGKLYTWASKNIAIACNTCEPAALPNFVHYMQFGTILIQNFDIRFGDCTYWNVECYTRKHKKWTSNIVTNHYRMWKVYTNLKHFMCSGKWKFCWHSASTDIDSKLNCKTPCIFSYERNTQLEITHTYDRLRLINVYRTSNLWPLPRAKQKQSTHPITSLQDLFQTFHLWLCLPSSLFSSGSQFKFKKCMETTR